MKSEKAIFKKQRRILYPPARAGAGYRNLIFWDLFFTSNYLFIQDLFTVSRFPRTLTFMLPIGLTLTVVGAFILKIVWDISQMYRDFLINPKNKFR